MSKDGDTNRVRNDEYHPVTPDASQYQNPCAGPTGNKPSPPPLMHEARRPIEGARVPASRHVSWPCGSN